MPDTVAPEVGAVIDTVGGVVSEGGGGEEDRRRREAFVSTELTVTYTPDVGEYCQWPNTPVTPVAGPPEKDVEDHEFVLRFNS